MKSVKIAVESRSSDMKNYHRQLRKLRLRNVGNGKYVGEFHNQRQIDRVHLFCSRHRLRFYYDNEYGHRSSNYRKKFFDSHPPDFMGRWYFCVYCGRLVKKEKVTVDHLYPLNQASKDLTLQKRMRKEGIPSVNSIENLVCSCSRCNRRKSDMITSKWLRKAKRGQHVWIWKARLLLRLVIVLGIAMAVIYFWPSILTFVKKIIGVF